MIFFFNICIIHLSTWSYCNASLGVVINGGGNFISCKPTFDKISCILFFKQANCATDFTQKVVSFSFFIYFLWKCQIIPKDSRSAVWTKQHTLGAASDSLSRVKTQSSTPEKFFFQVFVISKQHFTQGLCWKSPVVWGFKKCLSVFCPSKSHPLQKIIRHPFFFFVHLCHSANQKHFVCWGQCALLLEFLSFTKTLGHSLFRRPEVTCKWELLCPFAAQQDHFKDKLKCSVHIKCDNTTIQREKQHFYISWPIESTIL